jgi:pimeloyl-ACP methyl ester carboxylesterase
MARELHELLARSGLAGPFVLVGHSMGGLNVRLFEAEHPDQVAGMVLVDATVDPQRSRSIVPPEELKKFKEMIPKVGEGLDFDTFVAGAADVRASSKSLGAKPLVVLTRGMEDAPPWASAEQVGQMLRIWQEQQADLPKLSSNAIQIVVRKSHHYIQLDAPQIVIAAIGEVVRAARTQSRLDAEVFTALEPRGD